MTLALVERALYDRATAFEFFAAVRHLERLRPDLAPVGEGSSPDEEAVRFTVHPRLAYPAAEIQGLRPGAGGPPEMAVTFIGLTGPSGVLPYAYTELLIERLLQRDHGLQAFLDIFHHRIVALFYRAWKRSRFPVRYEEDPDESEEPLSDHLLHLGGLDPAVRDATVPVRTLAQYAALFAPEPRSAVGLESLVAGYFDVPVEVVQFVGGWYRVTRDDRCALDETGPPAQLGGALVGDEVWDPQGRVRLRIGPLERERYEAFLPGGRDHAALRHIARLYCHDQFTIELQLVLRSEDVPGLRIGEAGRGERLGWAAWIRTRERVADADETVLVLQP